MRGLVLSLFPGIGLLDMAFERTGFCVVRGPDQLWGGDVKEFSPPSGRFDGIIGGPPCQAFSRLRHLVEHNGYAVAENLIPEFERVVSTAAPRWFLMENVPDAPTPTVLGYDTKTVEFVDAWVGGDTSRRRAFTFGSACAAARRFTVSTLALHRTDPEPTVCASSGARPVPVAIGGSGKVKTTARHIATRKSASAMGFKTTGYLRDALRLQGLPPDFLDKAPFTVAGKIKVIGNGVPRAMGDAVAAAVVRALSRRDEAAA